MEQNKKNFLKKTALNFFGFTFLILFFFGITLFLLGNKYSSKKIFFRKTYGFIGISKNMNNIQLHAFNIKDNNPNPLMNEKDLLFDNNDIIIKKIDVVVNEDIRNIQYLNLLFTIEMKKEKSVIKGLFIKENYYSIGEINLMNADKSQTLSDHGVYNSFITNNIYKIVFGTRNNSVFFVNDVFFENIKIKKKQINTQFPAKYDMKESLEIEMEINFEVDDFDIFIIQPIFKIQMLEKQETFFIPLMATKSEKSLNYFEMREYIKNAKA